MNVTGLGRMDQLLSSSARKRVAQAVKHTAKAALIAADELGQARVTLQVKAAVISAAQEKGAGCTMLDREGR